MTTIKNLLFILILVSSTSIVAYSNENVSTIIIESHPILGNKHLIEIGSHFSGFNFYFVDYEFRLNSKIGLHASLGYPSSYMFGFKSHLKKKRSGPYIDLFFMNGGLNKINELGIDYGFRLLKHEFFGLFMKVGISKVLMIDENFENSEYNGEAHSFMLSSSIGLYF